MDAQGTNSTRCLAVDPDDLLAGSTVALECFVDVARRHPLTAARAAVWALGGRDRLRRELARRAELDASELPYCSHALEELRREAGKGSRLELASPADSPVTRRIAEHLGIPGGGGAAATWRPHAAARRPTFGAVTRTLRPYQWLKNTLVFLPFLLAHEIASAEKWGRALLMFAAFSLCASAAYVINDILDRGQDRRHPRRSLRPIASGELPLRTAIWLPAPLVAGAALCCLFLPPSCAAALAAYLGLTAFYSGAAKKLVMADVLLLAGLYLLRLIAGSLATGNVVSHWLLAFALTLFLSLALSKRVSELMTWQAASVDHAPGRGYRAADAPVLEAMAVASGFLACLIMVLYIQSPEILRLYRRPEYLWCGVVALLYWLGRLFVYSHRGECPDDPLFFALQDKTTLLVMAAAAGLAVLAV